MAFLFTPMKNLVFFYSFKLKKKHILLCLFQMYRFRDELKNVNG